MPFPQSVQLYSSIPLASVEARCFQTQTASVVSFLVGRVFFFDVHPVFGWEDFRLKLARLILALAERNPGEVARYESDLGRQEF